VAGDVRAVQLLRDALPGEVAGMLHVVDGARSGVNPLDDIAEDVAAAVGTVVERDTAAVLGKLAEELGQDDRGVEGPARTLEALAAAQVDVLVVRHDPALDRQAWFGPEPTQIGLTEDTARALGVDQPVAGPLVDVAVRAALATSATVRIVPGGTAPRDGLGAILRWA
jgi:peptide subunit release factor 1 (eRF1)